MTRLFEPTCVQGHAADELNVRFAHTHLKTFSAWLYQCLDVAPIPMLQGAMWSKFVHSLRQGDLPGIPTSGFIADCRRCNIGQPFDAITSYDHWGCMLLNTCRSCYTDDDVRCSVCFRIFDCDGHGAGASSCPGCVSTTEPPLARAAAGNAASTAAKHKPAMQRSGPPPSPISASGGVGTSAGMGQGPNLPSFQQSGINATMGSGLDSSVQLLAQTLQQALQSNSQITASNQAAERTPSGFAMRADVRNSLIHAQCSELTDVSRMSAAEFDRLKKEADGTPCGVHLARESIITLLESNLKSDAVTLKHKRSCEADKASLKTAPARLAHISVPEWTARHWVHLARNICLFERENEATEIFLDKITRDGGPDFKALWTNELSRRARGQGPFRLSLVTKFAAGQDPTWRTLLPNDPLFAAPGIRHAECVHLMIERDTTLVNGKRKDTEYWASQRIRIEASLFMQIIEDGKKVELFRLWQERWAQYDCLQQQANELNRDTPRARAIKMVYSCPANVIDWIYDSTKYGPTFLERDANHQDHIILRAIQEALDATRVLRRFEPSPAKKWGKADTTKKKDDHPKAKKDKNKTSTNKNTVHNTEQTTSSSAGGDTSNHLLALNSKQQKTFNRTQKEGTGGGKPVTDKNGRPNNTPLVFPCNTNTPDDLPSGEWSKPSCIRGLKESSADCHCKHPACIKFSKEMIAVNPDARETLMPCANHNILGCPFEAAERTKLHQVDGIDDLPHAAQVIRKLHRDTFVEVAFGKDSKYNAPDAGHRRSWDKTKALRQAQIDANLYSPHQVKRLKDGWERYKKESGDRKAQGKQQ